jgi:hypothetical protein
VWFSTAFQSPPIVVKHQKKSNMPRIDEENAWWGATPIGHLKDDHRLRRNYLKGRDGDRINAVLAAAGYNFSLLRRWFEEFLRALLLLTLRRAFRCASHRNVLHGRRSTRVMVAAQP